MTEIPTNIATEWLLPFGACFALYHKIYCVRYSNHWQIFLGHFLTFFDVKRPTNRWKMKNPCCSRLCFDRSVSSRADIWYTIICLISMLCVIILSNNFWLILLQIKKIFNSNIFQVWFFIYDAINWFKQP